MNCSRLVSNHRLILCSTVFHHLRHLLGNLNEHACCKAFPDLIQLSFAALVIMIMMIMIMIKNVQFQECPAFGNNQPIVCGFQSLSSLIVDWYNSHSTTVYFPSPLYPSSSSLSSSSSSSSSPWIVWMRLKLKLKLKLIEENIKKDKIWVRTDKHDKHSKRSNDLHRQTQIACAKHWPFHVLRVERKRYSPLIIMLQYPKSIHQREQWNDDEIKNGLVWYGDRHDSNEENLLQKYTWSLYWE